jgi:hypothetical protein
MGTRGDLSLGVKRQGREADHSLPSSAEVKNARSYTSTPQYVCMAWCLVKHRDIFTFTFTLPPFARDVLLTTLHPLLEDVMQTVCRKLQKDSGTGGFDFSRSFLRL